MNRPRPQVLPPAPQAQAPPDDLKIGRALEGLGLVPSTGTPGTAPPHMLSPVTLVSSQSFFPFKYSYRTRHVVTRLTHTTIS